jgi:hypothetical protein
MSLRARKNPAHEHEGKLIVLHPDTKREFPDGVFDLSDADAVNPRVRRLFAKPGEEGGLPGGVFGDLLAVTSESTAQE